MRIKIFVSYFNLTESNTTINSPNFSIVVPGGCNGKCDFCFWKKTNLCNNYIGKLTETLNNLPSQFHQISLTGGEPTISPYLKPILESINKNVFTRVVMTTNGAMLLKTIPIIEGKVDHINISRHHFEDRLNDKIFNSKMINKTQLKHVITELNKVGIDVTLSAVLNENLSNTSEIKEYLNFAKNIGASQVFFRKPHGNLDPTNVEKAFENYKSKESSCPVCRNKYQLIEGIGVSWKASLIEPSSAMNKIYELIFHEDGSLTKDWTGKLKVNATLISENHQLINESYQSVNEDCGYSSGCDVWGTPQVKARQRASHPYNPANSKDGIIKALYDYYVGGTDLKIGDKVIYHNSGKKHDGKIFIYKGIRQDDGKLRLSKDDFILYASPDRITPMDKDNIDKIEKFKKVVKTMVENGDIEQPEVDAFLNRKLVDPFDEEDW